ncbi:MAG: TraR/DksA C4-type zinc finger protein [Candidatus Paceibacterota bacterium]|jgi:RNA polymerase-binding transcription factor DksA
MKPEFIIQRKIDLERKKLELEEQLKSFANKTSDSNWQTNYPQLTDTPEDKVDEVEEYENLLPVEHSLEESLKDVNIALEKIEKGIYGKCENCGNLDCECEISEERLTILPEAKTCNTCKCKHSECKKEGK